MFGAFLSAVALMNSGTGPAAAMSYPLEVHFGVPHGIGGGIFLPHIIQHNINTGFFDYLQLYNSEDYNQSKEKSANIFISKVLNVWSSLEISQNLTEFGMQKRHIETFISDTIELKLALEQNPVPFYEKEILKILEKLIVN